MAGFDAVLVGSGINTLTAAALLARDGWSVCVLERSDRLGGAIRTEPDYTLPGFTHEVLSSWHPLFAGLRGLRGARRRAPPARSRVRQHRAPHRDCLPRRRRRCSSRRRSRRTSPSSTAGRTATAPHGSVSSRSSWPTPTSASACSARSSGRPPGLGSGSGCSAASDDAGLLEFAGHALSTCRDWTTATFRSDQAHGLLAPWVLHTGLGPENAVSGFMTQVIACAVQLGGMPVPVGGGVRLVDALAGIVRDAGGELRTDADVDADHRRRPVARPVSCSPTARRSRRRARCRRRHADRSCTAGCCGRRRAAEARTRPQRATATAARGCRSTSRWTSRRAGKAPTPSGSADGDRPRHAGARRRLAGGERGRARAAPRRGDDRRGPALRGRSFACARREVDRLDPAPGASRRPREGRRRRRARRRRRGWTEALREAYADRIVARLGESIENLASATLERVVLSPADLEALNPNLVARRHLRGQLRARPEPALAAVRACPRPPHAGRGPVARRGEHAPRPGARGGLRLPRREGADEAAAARAGSLQSFQDARETVALGDLDGERVVRGGRRRVRRRGVRRDRALGDEAPRRRRGEPRAPRRARACGLELRARPCPRSSSSRSRAWKGPPIPRCGSTRSARRSGASPPTSPSASSVLSGPLGGAREAEGRAIVVDGLTRAAAAAREAGVRLGFEPIHPAQRDTAGFVCSLADALALLDEAGLDDVGIMADTYNLAREDMPEVIAPSRRFTGLHVADDCPSRDAGRARPARRRPGPIRRARRRAAR